MFKEQCKLVKKCITSAKREYLSKKVRDCDKDQKQLFNVLRSFEKKVKPQYSETLSKIEISNKFSDFFTSKIESIRCVLDAHETGSGLPDDPTNVVVQYLDSFDSVSETCVDRIIRKSPAKSCGLDPIPTTLLKECLPSIISSITSITNSSLSAGYVPASLKQAFITPLLKKPSLDQTV